MKKLIVILLLSFQAVYAQETYYWVSGNSETGTLTGNNWSKTPGGSAVSRNNAGDILVFDNVTVTITHNANTTLNKLQLQNGAKVTIKRTTAGATNLTLSGDKGLVVTGNSTLKISGETGVVNVLLPLGGEVKNSEVYVGLLTDTQPTRLVTHITGGLVFTDESHCYIASTATAFGFNGSATPSGNSSAEKAVVFTAGTSLHYQKGTVSPFGNGADNFPNLDLDKESNFIIETSDVAVVLFRKRTFGNVIVKNNAQVGFNEEFERIHNLTIEQGASFLMGPSQDAPFTGSIINNGTFGLSGKPTTAVILMKGDGTEQHIGGTGVFRDLGALSVVKGANVKLGANLTLKGFSPAVILGKLDFGNYVISGTANITTSNAPMVYAESEMSKALIAPGTRILEYPDWYIWDSSPIVGDDGKIHVFFSRWPENFDYWISHSEICHAVADKPEGPYTFVGVVLKGRGGDYWDAKSVHNPTIHKVGNKYVIFYNGTKDATSQQRIGMAVADDLYGEFKRVGDEPILVAGANDWDRSMNNNPALLQHPNGKFWLYYKAWDVTDGNKRRIGVAFADNIEGPYTKYEGNPVLNLGKLGQVEDPYVFYYNNKFYMLNTDMGVINNRSGLMVTSNDGLNWGNIQLAYQKSSYYFAGETADRFERPQVLFQNGKPTYLFLSLRGGKDNKSTGVVLKIDTTKF